jgi:hypothetical protein
MIDLHNARGTDSTAHRQLPAGRRFATIVEKRDRYQNRLLMSRPAPAPKGDLNLSDAHRGAAVHVTRGAVPVQTAMAPRGS